MKEDAKDIKKRSLSPDKLSFINLKSNTMKNTDAKVRLFCNMARTSENMLRKSKVFLT